MNHCHYVMLLTFGYQSFPYQADKANDLITGAIWRQAWHAKHSFHKLTFQMGVNIYQQLPLSWSFHLEQSHNFVKIGTYLSC